MIRRCLQLLDSKMIESLWTVDSWLDQQQQQKQQQPPLVAHHTETVFSPILVTVWWGRCMRRVKFNWLESVSHLQPWATCTGRSFTFWLWNLQSHSDRRLYLMSSAEIVCVRAVLFFPPSSPLKPKFGVHSRVIGGLERATEPPPCCLSCHVGGVDLVILWESKVPLTAVWGVIHRAALEEGGQRGVACTLSATLLMN